MEGCETEGSIFQLRKHLYYKHETEHTVCKACHQKTWQHVYHFCIQPKVTVCEVCDKSFDSLKQYRSEKSFETGVPNPVTLKPCLSFGNLFCFVASLSCLGAVMVV